MTNATLRGKPDAGNPHVRFDEGEVAPVKPRRGSLLYTGCRIGWLLSVGVACCLLKTACAESFVLDSGVRVTTGADGSFALEAGGKRVAYGPLRLKVRAGARPRISCARAGGDAFTITVASSDPDALEEAALGDVSVPVEGVMFGAGYYLRRPGAFRWVSNGHAHATAYDAFAFTNGISFLVTASEPLYALFVDPAMHLAGVSVREPATFLIVPGVSEKAGAASAPQSLADCALRYRRNHFRKTGSAGTAVRRGKFVLDCWQGTFADHAAFIREAADRYGLGGDCCFLVHNWQRWGYDNRLPDVWPPNPAFGGLQPFLAAWRTAKERGWSFGVHHNVCDSYEDSALYAPEKVAYRKDGHPQYAWYNAWFGQQSWKTATEQSPVEIAASIDAMHRDGFDADCMFVDVIGSGPVEPYYTHGGVYRNPKTARAGIAKTFDVIREKLTAYGGRQAFTLSEAAHDYLVGHLDGGDCQFSAIARATGGEYVWYAGGDYASIHVVPWADLVNHLVFPLHGAGYSVRFEGGRGPLFHGIDSDDYLSVLMLTGHGLMTDLEDRYIPELCPGTVNRLDMPRALRQSVRLYWLAQHVARALKDAEITAVDFCGGDPDRTTVTWSEGTVIHVNRARGDWTIGGVVLPQYGFCARNPKTGLYAAILRRDGRVVEESAYRDGTKTVRYANARQVSWPREILPLTPQATGTYRAGRLALDLAWRVAPGRTPPPGDWTLGFWLVETRLTENSRRNFDRMLSLTMTDAVSAPKRLAFRLDDEAVAKLKARGEKGLDVLVSVTRSGGNPNDRRDRCDLLADSSFFNRFYLGRVRADGTFAPHAQGDDPALYARAFAPARPVDFGFCRTAGGFRLVTEPGREAVLTQLPGEPRLTCEWIVPPPPVVSATETPSPVIAPPVTPVASKPPAGVPKLDLSNRLLAVPPQALAEILPHALEAFRIADLAAKREARHKAMLRQKGIAEEPPEEGTRYAIDTGGLGSLVFDDCGTWYVDRRFVTEGEMNTVRAVERWIAKWFPRETARRARVRSDGRKGALPVFRGFEHDRYQRHDALIGRLTAAFNADKAAWCGGTAAQAGGIRDLDPALVKAHMIEESGGRDARSRAAWEKDPLQVNVPGDWGNEKLQVGLVKPRRRNEGTLEDNVRAAIKYLSRKGFSAAATPASERPKGYFDGWMRALQRYNGRRDRTDTNRWYSDEYAAKIFRRATHPDEFVPIEIRLNP